MFWIIDQIYSKHTNSMFCLYGEFLYKSEDKCMYFSSRLEKIYKNQSKNVAPNNFPNHFKKAICTFTKIFRNKKFRKWSIKCFLRVDVRSEI